MLLFSFRPLLHHYFVSISFTVATDVGLDNGNRKGAILTERNVCGCVVSGPLVSVECDARIRTAASNDGQYLALVHHVPFVHIPSKYCAENNQLNAARKHGKMNFA